MPGGHTGRMRQRNKIIAAPPALYAESLANHFLEFRNGNELRDRQSADWNDQAWPENFHFIIHPGRAVTNLLRTGNAVAASGSFAGKAPTNRCKINFGTHIGFAHSAKLFEPSKKCTAGGVSEGPLQNRFAHARGLSNQHYVA